MLRAVRFAVELSSVDNPSTISGPEQQVSQKDVRQSFIIEEKTKENPVTIFEKAIENIKPEMEVRAKRVGGAAYQVPMQVREERKESLAIRWLVAAARARSNSEFHTYGDKIAQELIDASNSEGGAVKKRMEMEKQADANRAFSHFKW